MNKTDITLIKHPLPTESENAVFLEECKAIIIEKEYESRWTLIEGYHTLGQRILQEQEYRATESRAILQRVAKYIERSERTVYSAVRLAKQYPDLNALPVGKNATWHTVCQKYLPKEKPKPAKKSCADVIDSLCQEIDKLIEEYPNEAITELQRVEERIDSYKNKDTSG